MILDIHTIIVLVALSALLMGAGMFVAASTLPANVQGASRWALSCVAQGLGWTLMALRGTIPDWISVVAGDGLILTAFWWQCVAVHKLVEKHAPRIWGYAILIVTLLILTVFSLLKPLPDVRAFAFSLATTVFCFWAARALLSQMENWTTSVTRRWLGWAFFYLAAIGLSRAISTVFSKSSSLVLLLDSTIQTLNVLNGYLTVVLMTFGFMLVCNEKFNAELSRLALTDALTGAQNRASIERMGAKLLAQARRGRRKFSVVLLDIDHFKRINDTHGHPCGDQVLREVVKTINSCLRAQDMLGRYGGEEFIVLLPDTGQDGALILAERLRFALENTPITFETSVVSLTASFGVAQINESGTLNSVLSRADAALYHAKKSGRNQVHLADLTDEQPLE